MPHDFNNTEVAVGDLVMIPCRVTDVFVTEDGKYCNLNVQTVHPMPPYETGSAITLNTRQVVMFGKGTFATADGDEEKP